MTGVNYYLLYYIERRRKRIEKKELRQANERTRAVQRQPMLIGGVLRKKNFSVKKKEKEASTVLEKAFLFSLSI